MNFLGYLKERIEIKFKSGKVVDFFKRHFPVCLYNFFIIIIKR